MPDLVAGLVAVSGGFDPLHVGHLALIREAKKLGDRLLVIVNNDAWLKRKKGRAFIPEWERVALVSAVRWVDAAVLQASPTDDSVSEDLVLWRPAIFANGGDRTAETSIREAETCRRLGIRMVFGVGGDKTRSSSELLTAWTHANA